MKYLSLNIFIIDNLPCHYFLSSFLSFQIVPFLRSKRPHPAYSDTSTRMMAHHQRIKPVSPETSALQNFVINTTTPKGDDDQSTINNDDRAEALSDHIIHIH